MNHAISNLQIHIHKVDASTVTFIQNDVGEAKRILDEFQPMQIFNQEEIVLTDRNLHMSFPASQVTRIDFDSEQHSHLIFPIGLVEAVELPEVEFETLIQNLSIRAQWKYPGARDDSVVTFLNAEMADGQCVLLIMEVNTEATPGTCELKDFLLNRSGLCFRMRSGGVAVLNLANLARLTIFPGVLQSPADMWNVRLLHAKQQANLAADNPGAPVEANGPLVSFSTRDKHINFQRIQQ